MTLRYGLIYVFITYICRRYIATPREERYYWKTLSGPGALERKCLLAPQLRVVMSIADEPRDDDVADTFCPVTSDGRYADESAIERC